MEPMTPAPATMQSAAMRRSGAIEAPPATMQSAAMRRSGAID
ncbi:cobalamin (vitamin b12) biosynthesis cbix protein [Mycobacterium tuberculosis]|nr:cobalamin (vitamin b12) biosynthesis cbix protein [Mycobacterium tuberculosis]